MAVSEADCFFLKEGKSETDCNIILPFCYLFRPIIQKKQNDQSEEGIKGGYKYPAAGEHKGNASSSFGEWLS